MAKDFKLERWDLSQIKRNFINSFSNQHDRCIVEKAFIGGMSIAELQELEFDPKTGISVKKEAAVFARTEYKLSHAIAKRIVTEDFDDDQIDVIMTCLLLPTYEFSEEKLLDEILYAKFSMDEIVDWVVKNQA